MVIDGIDSNGYYHFNFGLSGDPDGYFSMQTVFFNSSPSINFRIMKDEGGSPHPVFCCPDDFEYEGYYVGSPGLTTTSVFPIETYLAALAVENTSNHNIKYMDEGENKNYFLVDQQLADGDYTLTLRCFSPEDRTIYLGVGTRDAVTVRVNASPLWQDVSVPVSLSPGVNLIRLCNDRGPMPDVDYMDLQPNSNN